MGLFVFPFENTTTKRNNFWTTKQKEKYFFELSKVNPLKWTLYAYARRQKGKQLNINRLEQMKISLFFCVFTFLQVLSENRLNKNWNLLYIYTKTIVNQRFNIVNPNDSSFYNSNFKAVF